MNTKKEYDPKRLIDFKYLEETAENFDMYDLSSDREAVYRYAQLLFYAKSEDLDAYGYIVNPNTGEILIEEDSIVDPCTGELLLNGDKEKAIELFGLLFINFCQSGEIYDEYFEPFDEYYDEERDALIQSTYPQLKGYEDIFLGAEFFTKEFVGPTDYLLEMAQMIQKGIHGIMEANPQKAFSLVNRMPAIMGMVGGMELVEMVRILDRQTLFLANCYMHGIGVKQDLTSAFGLLLHYRTDHVAQKWHEDLIGDKFYELYAMLEKSENTGLTKYDLLYKNSILAVMTMEGIGCIPNSRKALEYLIKAKDFCDKAYKWNEGFKAMEGFYDIGVKRSILYNFIPYTVHVFALNNYMLYVLDFKRYF